MILREYKKSDIQRIVDLYNQTTLECNWVDLNEEQRKIMLFKDLEKAHILLSSNISTVLEIQGKIMGFVIMTLEGYINFLYVDKDELRKGYGKKLLLEIEKKAKTLGVQHIFLFASKFTSDRNIYEKMGFNNRGLEKYKILDVEFEGYKMEKKIL